MAGECLDDLNRGVALGKRCDVGVAERVEIGGPLVRRVGDAGGPQIGL
jgi:hypothetical protein